jgi:hypothetical protein
MRLKHIEVLHAIMVSGSLSGAARLLNVSQPAVTQSLQHAEVQLGYPLFKRVRNRLIPTQETLALYTEVDKLFAQLESVRTLARKPYPAIDGMRNVQRLLKTQNPRIADVNLEDLVDNRYIRKLDESGFSNASTASNQA